MTNMRYQKARTLHPFLSDPFFSSCCFKHIWFLLIFISVHFLHKSAIVLFYRLLI